MNRSLLSLSLSAACFALLLAGCQKSADQQSAQSATDSTSSASGSDASKSATKRPEPPPPPRPLVVPAETVISVVLDQAVGSKISTAGQAFSATVSAPVDVEGRVAIPKGARASGIVKILAYIQEREALMANDTSLGRSEAISKRRSHPGARLWAG